MFILMICGAFLQKAAAQNFGAYLIPRQIYVGDPATLVLPLPPSPQNKSDIVMDREDFPSHENIDFNKIILERRTAGNRLIIEFTAFVPGTIVLPEIKINEDIFTGLSVTVNSIIDGKTDRRLSGAAPALAIPGTAFMLYGSIALIIILLSASVWFVLKGRVVLKELREKWARFRLFSSIRITVKKLQRGLSKGIEKRFILDKLSDETRNFLSILTEQNCRSMTAREFKALPVNVTQSAAKPRTEAGAPDKNETVIRFSDFFYKCDTYRFSGMGAEEKDILQLLDDLLEYVDLLETTRRNEKQTEGQAA